MDHGWLVLELVAAAAAPDGAAWRRGYAPPVLGLVHSAPLPLRVKRTMSRLSLRKALTLYGALNCVKDAHQSYWTIRPYQGLAVQSLGQRRPVAILRRPLTLQACASRGEALGAGGGGCDAVHVDVLLPPMPKIH